MELGAESEAEAEAEYRVELSSRVVEQLGRLSPDESHQVLEACGRLVRLCRSALSAGAEPEGGWSSFLEEASRWVHYSIHPRQREVRVHSLESRAEEPAARAALHGATALVVEDDPRLREGLRELLECLGAEVRAVGDAAEALAHLAQAMPEVLVSDIGLPDLDGYEVVRRARALPGGARLAAVALTGCTTPADRARALAAGFDVHLGKPVEPARLVSAIAALLGRAPAAQAAPSSAG